MARFSRLSLLLICLLATVLSLPLRAADFTVLSNTAFADLDGSSDDDDGVVDGVFTVHGNLTLDAAITCNDPAVPPLASACDIKIVATGNVTINPGGSVLAENTVGTGSGGNVTIEAGGNLTLGTGTPGGRVSSSRTTTVFPNPAADNHAGNITLKAGGTVTVAEGAVVDASAARAQAGAIEIDAQNQVIVDGVIASGPSGTVLGTAFDSGRALAGAAFPQQYGGPITINAYTSSGPGILVNETGRIVSQGETAGGRTVVLEACGIQVYGLVASISKNNNSAVKLRSGGGILIDGTDLNNLGALTGRFGRVRADTTLGQTKQAPVLLVAQDGIQVFGPAEGSTTRFAVSANPGGGPNALAGKITVTSLGSTVEASGQAFQASAPGENGRGGAIAVGAAGAINLDTALLIATGDFTPPNAEAKTGDILLRSYSAGISWKNGVGDVRPLGPTLLPQRRWRLELVYCTTVDMTGTDFPTEVSIAPPWPGTRVLCGIATPPLPSGETLPVCGKAPNASDDSYSANSGVQLNVPAPGVLINDTGTGPLAATAQAAAPTSQGGTVTVNADGSFSYLSAGGFTGTDTFTYQVTNASGSDTATVTINVVNSSNDPPVAVDDVATVAKDDAATAIDVLANDSDPDGDSLIISIVTQPANGTVVITNGGADLTYEPDLGYCNTPPGTTLDTFTYTADDGNGSTDTATVTVTVTCTGANQTPDAVDDVATVGEDSLANTINVLLNDSDPDNDPLKITGKSDGANGTVAITNGGADLTYTPNTDYCNSPPGNILDTFTYTVDDGNGGTDTATVTVTVTCANDPPTANPDAANITEEAPNVPAANTVSGNVLTNDADVDSSLTVSAVSGGTVGNPKAGTYGSVTINGNGSFTYTLDDNNLTVNALQPGQSLVDPFGYTASDGSLTSSSTLTVTIHGADDPATPDNDAFDFIGNTQLEVDRDTASTPEVIENTATTNGVLEGDVDPDGGPAITISGIVGCGDGSAPFDCVIAGEGTVSLQANGSFSFIPEAGDADATASFQYTLVGNANPGTVTLTRFERVWYVNPNAGGGGTGTSAAPFNTLDSLDGVGGAGDADSPGDYIFIHAGSLTLSATMVMEANQRLIGEGSALSIPVNLNANGSPTNLVAAGTRPQVSNAAGNAVSIGTAIPVEIIGLSLQGSLNAIDLTAAAALTGSSALTIGNNVFRGAGAEGIDINLNAGTTGILGLNITTNSWDLAGVHTGNAVDVNRAAGTLNLNFSNNTNILSAANGVVINGGAAAFAVITGSANNTVHQNTGGAGILIQNATFDASAAAGYQQVSGGTTTIGVLGDGVGGGGLLLQSVQGDLGFTDLDVFAGGTAVQVTGTGAVNTAAGTGTRVTVGAGVATIASTGGPALDLNGLTADLQLSALTSANSASTGVSLTNVADGTTASIVSAGSGSSITNATGTDFAVSGGNATITYEGTITDDLGQLVSVGSTSGDSVTFTGAITDNDNGTGNGVSLGANAATITFRGGLVLSTGGNAAFTATGGGTINVCDESPCNAAATGALINKITTTTGTALNVANTTIGSNNLEFQSISTDGTDAAPSNAIVLNSTGTSGGLKVKGTGSANTGGTIRDTLNDAISLTSTERVSLNWMNITSNLGSGVKGTSVNGFVMTGSSVTLNGDSAAGDDSGVDMQDLAGTTSGGTHPTSITNTTFNNNLEFQVQIQNTTGTLANFQFIGNSITDPGTDGQIGHMLNFLAEGSTNMTLTATGNAFTGTNNGTTGRSINADASGGTLAATIGAGGAGNGNTFTNQDVAVSLSTANAGNLSFGVVNNTATGNFSHGLNLFVAASSTGTVSGEFANNIVGTFNSAGSGSQNGNGIRIQNEGSSSTAPVTVRIQGNTVQEMAQFAAVQVNQGTFSGAQTRRTNATIVNNVLREVDQARAINVFQNNSSGAGTGGFTCANISGNTMSNIAGNILNNLTRISLLQANSGTFQVTQAAPTAAVNPLELDDANSVGGNTTTPAQIVTTGTITYSQAACPVP